MAISLGGYTTPTNNQGLVMPGSRPTGDALRSQYSIYNNAVDQQATDYGDIMSGYKKLFNTGPSSDYTSAVSNLGDLARTGGYSDQNIADIRERGISPIRSIYASANRDVDRQRALQGGYSPNYAAVKAKMARDLSTSIGDQVSKVNADLAERIAQGRLAAAPAYASAADRATQIPLQALQGMTSLYGTTPALSQLFGNQALQGAQFQNQVNQEGFQNQLAAIGQLMRLG